MTNEVLDGGCLCGAVTYQVRAPFLRFAHCHCSRCRKATGTGHAANLYVSPDHYEWTSGQDSVVRYDLPTAQFFDGLLPNLWLAPATAYAQRQRGGGSRRFPGPGAGA